MRRICRPTSPRAASTCSRRWQLDHGEDIELRQSGSLQAIHTAAQHDFARERVAALRARGHVIELLGIRDARSLEPALSPALLGAVYSPLRSQADPERATRAFARVAERTGRPRPHRSRGDRDRAAAGGRLGGPDHPRGGRRRAPRHRGGRVVRSDRRDARSRHPDRPRARSDVGDRAAAAARLSDDLLGRVRARLARRSRWRAVLARPARGRAAGPHAPRRRARHAPSLRPPAPERRGHLRRGPPARRVEHGARALRHRGESRSRGGGPALPRDAARRAHLGGPDAVLARRQAADRPRARAERPLDRRRPRLVRLWPRPHGGQAPGRCAPHGDACARARRGRSRARHSRGLVSGGAASSPAR